MMTTHCPILSAMVSDAARCNARLPRDEPLHRHLRRAVKGITINGRDYPSHTAAAEALGVSRAMISKAKRAGRLNTVGLGRK